MTDPALEFYSWTISVPVGYEVETVTFRKIDDGPVDPPTTTNPDLVLGTGWTEPTPQPPDVGSSGLKTPARWNLVPKQPVSDDTPVGVIAYHQNGIDRVELSANNGPWITVTEMTKNLYFKADEYWATLKSDGHSGEVELRAVVYPNDGVPHVLSTTVYTNPPMDRVVLVGTDRDHKTIKDAAGYAMSQWDSLDHVRFLLDDGEYHYEGPSISAKSDYWCHIEGGLNAKIVSASTSGLKWAKVQFQMVTIEPNSAATVLNATGPYAGFEGALWVHRCTYQGPGRDVTHLTSTSAVPTYWTVSEVYDCQTAFRLSDYVANCTAMRIGEDAVKLCPFVVNVDTEDISGGQPEWHTDVYQLWGTEDEPIENAIVQGLTGRLVNSQGLFLEKHVRDSAFVGVDIDNQTGTETNVQQCFQLGNSTHNLYFKDGTYVGNTNTVRTKNTGDPVEITAIKIESCNFTPALSIVDGAEVEVV